MQIFIPTLGRSDCQVTWHNLPPLVQMDTKLVVQHHERLKYEGYPTIVLPSEIKSIGPTRQWLVDNGPMHILMLDDDLDFAVRRSDDPTKFLPARDVDVHHMIHIIKLSLAENFNLVGVSGREGANRDTSQFKYSTRQLRVHGINTRFFRSHNIRFDRVPFMEDFDVTLQLLELGYPNRVLNGWVHNQRGGSNAPGGCSITRTIEAHNAATIELQRLHPSYVRIVEKESGNWGAARLDVYIQWKRAYDAGKRSSGLLDTGTGECAPDERIGST